MFASPALPLYALARQRFEMFRVGYPTPEDIKEATLPEILSFAEDPIGV